MICRIVSKNSGKLQNTVDYGFFVHLLSKVMIKRLSTLVLLGETEDRVAISDAFGSENMEQN